MSFTWRTSMRIRLDSSTRGPFRDCTVPKPADRCSWCHWLTSLQFRGCKEDQHWDTGPRRMTVSGQRVSMIVAGPKIACGEAGISKLRLGQHRNRMPLVSTCIWHCCTRSGADEPKCPPETGSHIKVGWFQVPSDADVREVLWCTLGKVWFGVWGQIL